MTRFAVKSKDAKFAYETRREASSSVSAAISASLTSFVQRLRRLQLPGALR